MNRRHGGGCLTGWRASDNARLNHARTADNARIKAAMQAPPAPPAPPVPAPQAPREPYPVHYLHGDQHETRAGEYFCKRCDVFWPADHFTQGAHGMALADHLDLRARHRDNVKRVQRAGGFCGREAMAGNVFTDLRHTEQTGGLHD